MKIKTIFISVLCLLAFPLVSSATYGVPDVSVDLRINGQKTNVNLMYGSAPTISWTSLGTSACDGAQVGSESTSTSLWRTGIGTSGSLVFDHVTNDTVFYIVCTNSSGNIVRDNVSAHVGFLVTPSVALVTSKEYGGLFIPGKYAYLSGSGFLPDSNMVRIGTTFDSATNILATSTDGTTMSFIVPEMVTNTYNLWVNNWNGVSQFKQIMISGSTSALPPAVPPAYTPPTPPTPVTPTPPVTTPPTTPALCPYLTYDLKYKSRDAQTGGGVSILQGILQKKGYLNSEPTGYFGAMTLAAVKQFQSTNGVSPVSGLVGPLTRAKIHTLNCQ